MGQAVGSFRSLIEFSVDYESTTVAAFLGALGYHPSLKEIHCFHTQTGDELSKVLTNFPNLTELSLVPSVMSGDTFPLLPNLQSLDLSFSPVTATGLKKIAQCPKLEYVSISRHPMPTPKLGAVIQELAQKRPSLEIGHDEMD